MGVDDAALDRGRVRLDVAGVIPAFKGGGSGVDHKLIACECVSPEIRAIVAREL